MDKIIKIFEKYNLPLELTALPHVESSFNINAYSKFGAAGLWQFTRGTGRQYLKINYTVDQRFDPEKASGRQLRNNGENNDIGEEAEDLSSVWLPAPKLITDANGQRKNIAESQHDAQGVCFSQVLF